MKIATKQKAGEEREKNTPLPSPATLSDTFASLYAEETLLGTLLHCPLDGKTSVDQCFEYLEPSDFQDVEHQLLFGAIKCAFEKTGRILPTDVINLLKREVVSKKISIELFSRLANIIVFSDDLSLLIYEIKKTSILNSLKETIHSKFNSMDVVDTIGLIEQCQELLSENKNILLQLDNRLLNGK